MPTWEMPREKFSLSILYWSEIIHPTIGGQYLSGVWTAGSENLLLLCVETASCRHVVSHGAPSWPLMVTDASILCFTMRIFETTPYDVKICQIEGTSQHSTKYFDKAKSTTSWQRAL